MHILRSDKVKAENQRFYTITQWAYVIGFFGHIGALLQFQDLGISEMVWLNITYSIPCFAIAFLLNRNGKHNAAFLLAFIELLIHQIVGTYYLGWSVGAHFWLIYLAGLCFFNPAWPIRLQLGLLIIVLISYVLIHSNFQNGVYVLDPEILSFNELTSAVVTITIISLLINYYSKTARKAEEGLIKEKEKTVSMLEKVEVLFGQQVSQEIAQELISSDVNFDSRQFDVSVLFMDIRDFTRFADNNEPQEVARFQNAVFGELIEIVKRYDGVVLQILGDGLMVVFGAPVIDEHHADKAVAAGYALIAKIRQLSDQEVIPRIKIGIGINSGKVIAGNVGNQSRRFYSLTGKNVIIAANLENLSIGIRIKLRIIPLDQSHMHGFLSIRDRYLNL